MASPEATPIQQGCGELGDTTSISFGSCSCDLTASSCDANCCCDADCSEDDKDAFVCVAPPTPLTEACTWEEHVVYSNTQELVTRTATGLFCVHVDNNAGRHFYKNPCTPNTPGEFKALVQAVDHEYDFGGDTTAGASGGGSSTNSNAAVMTYCKQGPLEACTRTSGYHVGDEIVIGSSSNTGVPPAGAAAKNTTTPAPDTTATDEGAGNADKATSDFGPGLVPGKASGNGSVPTTAAARTRTTATTVKYQSIPPLESNRSRMGFLGLPSGLLSGLCVDLVPAGFLKDESSVCSREFVYTAGGFSAPCPSKDHQHGLSVESYSG